MIALQNRLALCLALESFIGFRAGWSFIELTFRVLRDLILLQLFVNNRFLNHKVAPKALVLVELHIELLAVNFFVVKTLNGSICSYLAVLRKVISILVATVAILAILALSYAQRLDLTELLKHFSDVRH